MAVEAGGVELLKRGSQWRQFARIRLQAKHQAIGGRVTPIKGLTRTTIFVAIALGGLIKGWVSERVLKRWGNWV